MKLIIIIGLTAFPVFAANQIEGARIRSHVRFLAHDLLEGRGVGTRGGQLSEEYLAAQLAALGAEPAGENGSYFQTVPLVGIQTQPDAQLNVSGNGKSIQFKWQDEFVGSTHRQQTAQTVESELIFAGHGIVAPEADWNDYKDVDVRGKVVILFTNEPQPDNPQIFKGRTLTYYGRWTYKYEQALRQGAAGAILVHTDATAGYGWEVVRNSWGKEDPQMKLEPGQAALAFAGWITEAAGQRLFGLSGRTVQELMKAADSPSFRPIPLGVNIRGQVNSSIRPILSRNVAAKIQGSDPARADEYVMFSAHWDHLGISVPMNGDAIYNGAVDNATGCGILLELARVWANLEKKPRRSALFMAWTAEESGLRGSQFYSAHPLAPPGKTALVLNYDAVLPGPPGTSMVMTGAERTSAWPIVQEAAERSTLGTAPDPFPEQGSFYRSDHFMLARVGIPAFTVRVTNAAAGSTFSDYNTTRYHKPADQYDESWNFASLEQVAKLGFTIGLNIANSTVMPTWLPGDEFLAARISSGVR